MRIRLVLVAMAISTWPAAGQALGCGDTARCELHRELARYEGEDEYPDGVHYRVFVHDTGDRDASGQLVKHKMRVKCEEAAAAARCPERPRCPLHKQEIGEYEGEDEYPGGVHYRVFVHDTGDRDENGKLKKHKFSVRCE
jgi:hypothetical protein